jgi:hypothetical protein
VITFGRVAGWDPDGWDTVDPDGTTRLIVTTCLPRSNRSVVNAGQAERRCRTDPTGIPATRQE